MTPRFPRPAALGAASLASVSGWLAAGAVAHAYDITPTTTIAATTIQAAPTSETVPATATTPAATTPTTTTETTTTTTQAHAKTARTPKKRKTPRSHPTTTATMTSSATTTTPPTNSSDTNTAVTDVWSSLGSTSSALGALSEFSGAVTGDVKPPEQLVAIYQAAARQYHVPWQILAAINAVETDYGGDERTSSAGAVGFMQFMPATWHEYAVDADGDKTVSPYDARDAIFAAADLLEANRGADHLRQAIYAYNHAAWYVNEVVFVAARIVGEETRPSVATSSRLSAMRTAAELLNGTPYVWGGGHSGWEDSAGYDCSGFVSAVLHAAGYLQTPATTQTLSSAAQITAGPGRWVTIFDRTDGASATDDHVIIDLDGEWWESGGSSADGGAGDVHRITGVTTAYLATFNLVLHPTRM